MTLSFQRLLIILFSLILLFSAVLLILFNSKNNIIFFYTPTELLKANVSLNKNVRIGAFVKKGSLKIKAENKYEFIVTDNVSSIKITYSGLLPDLFREEQGIVIEGKLLADDFVQAHTVYAKHDENYIPENIKQELENNQYWQKKY